MCARKSQFMSLAAENSGYNCNDASTAQIVAHLRWLRDKDELGQDVFIVAAPGPEARWLIALYCELTGRSYEVVVITRDTTDTDLLQRRELIDGSVTFADGAVVDCATTGKILILDGIERAERNVMPVLNNLLENRSCPLESGGSIIAASRFDALLKSHSRDEVSALQLRRCHEQFRIVAVGAPVPPFIGNPLDPPLRSRFAALRLGALSPAARLKLAGAHASAPLSAVWALEQFALSQQSTGTATRLVRVPAVPSIAVSPFAARSATLFAEQSIAHLLRRVLPLDAMAQNDAGVVWRAIADVVGVQASMPTPFAYTITDRVSVDGRVELTFTHTVSARQVRVDTVSGGVPGCDLTAPQSMVILPSHADTLAVRRAHSLLFLTRGARRHWLPTWRAARRCASSARAAAASRRCCTG
jgi:hypothetical protein